MHTRVNLPLTSQPGRGKLVSPHWQSWRRACDPLLDPDQRPPLSLHRAREDLRQLARGSMPIGRRLRGKSGNGAVPPEPDLILHVDSAMSTIIHSPSLHRRRRPRPALLRLGGVFHLSAPLLGCCSRYYALVVIPPVSVTASELLELKFRRIDILIVVFVPVYKFVGFLHYGFMHFVRFRYFGNEMNQNGDLDGLDEVGKDVKGIIVSGDDVKESKYKLQSSIAELKLLEKVL
ncbi:hypothetical protein Sjap_019619 [Stephania japonica]|uniref:Uncharacterized protein n=1 Tax=Stephania japonica TaxID=461633 RepID=A0AAP0F1U9_9MAGN